MFQNIQNTISTVLSRESYPISLHTREEHVGRLHSIDFFFINSMNSEQTLCTINVSKHGDDDLVVEFWNGLIQSTDEDGFRIKESSIEDVLTIFFNLMDR